MYSQFQTIEESEEFLGREVMIDKSKARLIKIEINNERLYFNFKLENSSVVKFTSSESLYLVRIDGHLFGKI